MLAGKHAPRAPKAGLHLVHDEQRPSLLAQRLHPAQVFTVAGNDPTLALHHLQDDRRRLLVHRLLHPFQPVVGHEREARHQGFKGLAVLLAPGGRKRAESASVKAAHRGHYFRPAGTDPGELERCFHCLGPRIAQEGPFQTWWGDTGQFGQQLGTLVVVETVGTDRQPLYLFRHGLDHGRVGVTHIRHTVAADTVNVFSAISVPQPCPLPSHQHQGLFGIEPTVVALLQGDDLIVSHRAIRHCITVPWPTSAWCNGWATRPSAMTTCLTPSCRASIAPSSFFFIRPWA